MSNRQFGVQLWTTRGNEPLAKQLESLAELGVRDVQIYPDLLADAKEVAACLRDFGMACGSGHFLFDSVVSNTRETVEIARLFDMRTVVIPWLDPEERPREAAGWKALHAQLRIAKRALDSAQLGLAWHNHEFELAPLPCGSLPIDWLLGDDIDFAIDLGWVRFAGFEPAVFLDRYEGRIPIVHLKDLVLGEAGQDRSFTDIGRGVIDWHLLVPRLEAAGIEMFIEHDGPADWHAFCRNSLEYLNSLK